MTFQSRNPASSRSSLQSSRALREAGTWLALLAKQEFGAD